MNHLLLRWRYSVEMVGAYLADRMGEDDVADAHLSRAQKLREEIPVVELNERMDLFEGERR